MKKTRKRYFSGLDYEGEPLLVEIGVAVGSAADLAEASEVGGQFGMTDAREITAAECAKAIRRLNEAQHGRCSG